MSSILTQFKFHVTLIPPHFSENPVEAKRTPRVPNDTPETPTTLSKCGARSFFVDGLSLTMVARAAPPLLL